MTLPTAAATIAPPGPKGPRVKSLVQAAWNPLGFVTSMTVRYGEFVTLREGKTYLAASPDAAQRVLQENHMNYEKGSLYRRALRPMMGNGVFIAEGEAWKRQRHIAQPAFSRTSHDFFAETIVKHCAEMRERWLMAARESQPVNLLREVMNLTLKIGFRLMFSDRVDDRTVNRLVTAFLACEREMSIVRVFFPVHLPTWLPTPSSVRFRRSMRVLDDFIHGAIRSRRELKDEPSDLLGMYMHSTLENGEKLDDETVRDEMLTLLGAGQSVTDAVCWMFVLLTAHPDAAERVWTETERVVGTRLPTLADLKLLPYSEMTVKESLRLYPPAWGFMRTALHEDVVCGYPIPPGARIIVSPYLTHRLPRLWESPDRFDPERFSPERSEGRHRFAWFPFGQGPRKCIGTGLAMLESQFLLPIVYQAFEVAAVPGPPVRPVTRISMKQDRPFQLLLKPRPEFQQVRV